MANTVILEGWLFKYVPCKKPWQSKWWTKLWFVLSKDTNFSSKVVLQSFTNDKCLELKDSIDLSLLVLMHRDLSGRIDTREPPPQSNRHIFSLITDTQKLYLATDSIDEMNKWVDTIRPLIPWKRRSTRLNSAPTAICPNCHRPCDCRCRHPGQSNHSITSRRRNSSSSDSDVFLPPDHEIYALPHRKFLETDWKSSNLARCIVPVDRRRNASTSSYESCIPISQSLTDDVTPPVIDRNLKPRKKNATDSCYDEIYLLNSAGTSSIRSSQSSSSYFSSSTSNRASFTSTVYNTIDFIKTRALTNLFNAFDYQSASKDSETVCPEYTCKE